LLFNVTPPVIDVVTSVITSMAGGVTLSNNWFCESTVVTSVITSMAGGVTLSNNWSCKPTVVTSVIT
jgi:hypothetical protein